MAYVKRHPTNNLKRSIDYIKNKSKTDELLTYENLLPSSDTNEIVAMMNQTKDAFKKSGGIQGHHFIQSFKFDENITLELAHQIGKEWSDSFLSDYEFVLATHKDKDHLHNHIIINAVNAKNGKKYLKNDKELKQIRELSDDVCKEHDLSIITPQKTEKNKVYGEWKYQKESISWKDKIRNDIDDSITQSDNYDQFIEEMTKKNYTLRYGDTYKYNAFEHFDIGKRVRGKTLGDAYTETRIKARILNKDVEKKSDRLFFEGYYFLKAVPQKEIVQTDIDLSILESANYDDFISRMQDKGYTLRYGNQYKYNAFKHQNMKRSIRGKTIGRRYTEQEIKTRIERNQTLIKQSAYESTINLDTHTVFSKRYINNKYTYLKPTHLTPLSDNQKAVIQNKRQLLKDNQLIAFFKQNNLREISEYLTFKKDVDQELHFVVNQLNTLGSKHKELLADYTNQPHPKLKQTIIENAKKHEAIKEKYTALNKKRADFRSLDTYLIDKQKEKAAEKKQDKQKEKGRETNDSGR
jgi:hypothetical protein